MALNSKALIVALAVALFAASCSSGDDSIATDATTTVPESVSGTPESVLPAADDQTTTTTTGEPTEPTIDDPDDTTTEVDNPTCEAPSLKAHYVDVALDDPDGGLNMRTAPGVENEIVGVFPRSKELISTGDCQTLGAVDWWEVTNSDGTLTGWVSSRFLSDQLVFNPGLGKAISDTDNVGIGGETLDELAANLADEYGFDEDVNITMIGEPVGADAIGGMVTYEMTGLKDDASNGYLVEIDFIFDKNETEEGTEVVSYTAAKITNYALCTRGVTEDGLCV